MVGITESVPKTKIALEIDDAERDQILMRMGSDL